MTRFTCEMSFLTVAAAATLVFACDDGLTQPTPTIIAVVSGDAQSDTIGATLREPLVVRVVSSAGDGVPGIQVQFNVIEGDARLSDSQKHTGADGRASVSLTLGGTAGAVVVEGVNNEIRGSPVRFRLITQPGTPTQLVTLSGDGQLRFPNSDLLEPLIVAVVDRAGNQLQEAGMAVGWSVVTGGGLITPLSGVADAAGEASAVWRLGPAEGINTVEARSGNLELVRISARAAFAGPIVVSQAGEGLVAMNTDGSDAIPVYSDASSWDPSWSPDGTRLAFARGMGEGRHEIFTINADGSGVQQLTFSQADVLNLHPAWSPDGSLIAFASTRSGDADIYVMNPDGTGIVNLTNNPDAPDQNPAWSPDGSDIVFAACRGGDCPPDLWIMDADGSNPARLTDLSGGPWAPDWSPDGSRILFTRDTDVWAISPDGTGLERLAVAVNGLAAWSPDGEQIIYSNAGNGGALDIFLLDLESGEEVNLTNDPASSNWPAWRR